MDPVFQTLDTKIYIIMYIYLMELEYLIKEKVCISVVIIKKNYKYFPMNFCAIRNLVNHRLIVEKIEPLLLLFVFIKQF